MHVLRLVHFGAKIWTYFYFDLFCVLPWSDFAVTWYQYS